MIGDSAISIIRRLIDPGRGDLAPEAAQAVLQLHLTESDQAHMAELAFRSTQGTLSGSEAEEYDAYIAASDLLSLWKSKARISMKHHTSAALQ